MEGGNLHDEEEKQLMIHDKKTTELIDMLTEDDDLLVDSPFQASFSGDHTGFRISGFRADELPRPSSYRKSIAWDSEFFDSPGFLDSGELSRINKGFKSRPNTDNGDWFEIEFEPSIHKPKPCVMPNNKALKIETSLQSNTRRRRGTVSSPNPPMGSGGSIPTRSKLDFSAKSNAKTKNISATSSGQNLFVNSVLSPTGISLNAQTLNHQKIKSRIRGSLSASKIWRRGDQNTNTPPVGSGTSVFRSSSVDRNKRRCKDENEAKHRQSPVKSPSKQFSVGSLWDKSIGTSKLRRPSPRMGFFNENTSPTPTYHDLTRIRKLPQKVLPEGSSSSTQFTCSNIKNREKLTSHLPEVAKDIKRQKLADHATNSSHAHQSLKPAKKKAADQENRSKAKSSEPRDLSECFKAIDLNQEKSTTQLIRKRAPLADKTCSSNNML